MDLLETIILGIIEGITEFLPISSTAHLIFFSKVLGLKQTEFIKLFEVFIQSGAILSVIFIYFSYLKTNSWLIKYLLISFLPTALVGFLLHKIIKSVFFESIYLIVFSLFFIGLLFIIFEKFVFEKRKKFLSLKNIDFYQALIIGFCQSLAIVPGVSRAGAVILTMMIIGFKRKDSALYSFLLAVPTIFSASFYDFYKSKELFLNNLNYLYLLVLGFIISFIFAYLSVKWLVDYLRKHNLIFFGIYRILLAIIILIIVSVV